MNKYFTMFGSKTKVMDENENQIAKDTSENLQEILIKEMENQLGDLNEKIAKLTEKIKYNKKSLIIWLLVFILLIPIPLRVIPSVFHQSVLSVLMYSIWGVAFLRSGCESFASFNCYLSSKQSLHITELQSFYLKRVILKKKQELEELKEYDQKIEVVEEESENKKVEDEKVLLNLRCHLEILKRYNKSFIQYEADKYARGFWGVEEKEKVIEDGLDANIYEDYLVEYNTRKLMKDKRTL